MRKYGWIKDEIKLLRLVYPKYPAEEAARFFPLRSLCAISAMAHKLGIKGCSPRSVFAKGHVPANKGKKITEYCTPEVIEKIRKNTFKKGNIPHNTVPEGYERYDEKHGMIWFKPPGSRRMVQKNRWVWEQYNGPVPKGCNIQFKDGNIRNCDISNLYMISRADQMRYENSFHSRYPEDLKRLIRLKGTLKRQINRREKK